MQKNIKIAIIIIIIFLFSCQKPLGGTAIIPSLDSLSEQKTNSIFKLAKEQNWKSLPIGDRIIKVALQFLGTEYKGGTLEGDDEICRVNLNGLDCVTFVENSLDFARIIKKDKLTIEALFEEITATRYRDGQIIDYTSRLHYTADWINQNLANGIVEYLPENSRGEKIRFNLNFMSQNPKYYNELQKHPDYVEKIKEVEENLNQIDYYYIPKENIATYEQHFQNGDIICIVTSKLGLDYSHLGLIYVDSENRKRFMHASSTKKQVVIDTTVSVYLNSIKSNKGITILRAKEVLD